MEIYFRGLTEQDIEDMKENNMQLEGSSVIYNCADISTVFYEFDTDITHLAIINTRHISTDEYDRISCYPDLGVCFSYDCNLTIAPINVSLIEYLISNGAMPHRDSYRILQYALKYKNLDILELLISKSYVDSDIVKIFATKQLIHSIVKEDVRWVEELIKLEADVNCENNRPIDMACMTRNEEVLDLLIKNGAVSGQNRLRLLKILSINKGTEFSTIYDIINNMEE